MKLMAVGFRLLPSFRDGAQAPDPESRHSGFASSMRPGMTTSNFWPSSFFPPSIRFRQTEHLLGDKTENELRADRGDAGDQRFAQIALDVKFLGVAEAAMGHDRLLAGLEAGFGG